MAVPYPEWIGHYVAYDSCQAGGAGDDLVRVFLFLEIICKLVLQSLVKRKIDGMEHGGSDHGEDIASEEASESFLVKNPGQGLAH